MRDTIRLWVACVEVVEMRNITNLIICIIFLSLLNIQAFAHPGRTDSDGGHWNHSSGEYHYHHGKPAHDHISGRCPYDVNEVTSSSSSIDAEDKAFFTRVGYVCLGLIAFGIGNRIRVEIKERRK